MTNRIAVNAADPLAGLIARVIEDLKQRTAAGLAGGAMLEGDGWRLAAMQLSVVRGRSVETLPFAEIDKVAVFDGKICLWRRGQDEPAAKIKPDSKNASVLASLLTEWIEHQREASGGQPEAIPGASGMGRLLFERRRNEGFWLGIVAAAVSGATGAAMLFDRNALPFVGVVLLLAAVASLLLGLLFGRYRFRCNELGLTRRRGRDEVRLLYDEIAEFTYAATRMFYKGAIRGRQLSLTFRAPRASDPLFGEGAEHGRRSRRAPRPHCQDDRPADACRFAGRPRRAMGGRPGLRAPRLAVPPLKDVGSGERPGRDPACTSRSATRPSTKASSIFTARRRPSPCSASPSAPRISSPGILSFGRYRIQQGANYDSRHPGRDLQAPLAGHLRPRCGGSRRAERFFSSCFGGRNHFLFGPRHYPCSLSRQ